MRLVSALSLTAAAIIASAITFGATAQAEDQFDVKVAGDAVTVTAKGSWHINEQYPWKAKVGDKTIDKSGFAMSATTATVKNLPKGKATIKGGVCSADNCVPFSKEITVN